MLKNKSCDNNIYYKVTDWYSNSTTNEPDYFEQMQEIYSKNTDYTNNSLNTIDNSSLNSQDSICLNSPEIKPLFPKDITPLKLIEFKKQTLLQESKNKIKIKKNRKCIFGFTNEELILPGKKFKALLKERGVNKNLLRNIKIKRRKVQNMFYARNSRKNKN